MLLYGKNPEYTYLTSPERFSDLLALCQRYRMAGPIRQSAIAWLILADENPFSLACERRDPATVGGSLSDYARADLAELTDLFFDLTPPYDLDFVPMGEAEDTDSEVGSLATTLAAELRSAGKEGFFATVLAYYARYGVGKFGLHRAFYLTEEGEIAPVSHFRKVGFDELWGYELQKEQVISNTVAFLEGRGANNMLLYGDAGTGKSTCIKALLNQYYESGLRMIQVQKYQFVHLSCVIDEIRRRNYRFAIYMDDLSFEDFEVEYKYLKAAIEGGLCERPSNMLIFATSNRRHLIKETFSDREGGGDIHRDESIQEKISLSDRFGLQVRFGKPAQDEYFEMVLHLARLHGIRMDEKALLDGARTFSVRHSGFSGRIAMQYILSLE
jgi:predicted AAA+ superfamily ATPase